jgi:hypothetical protein
MTASRTAGDGARATNAKISVQAGNPADFTQPRRRDTNATSPARRLATAAAAEAERLPCTPVAERVGSRAAAATTTESFTLGSYSWRSGAAAAGHQQPRVRHGQRASRDRAHSNIRRTAAARVDR